MRGQLHDPAASIPDKTSPARLESEVGWPTSLTKNMSKHNYLISYDLHSLLTFYRRIKVTSTELVYPLESNSTKFQDTKWL